MYRFAIDNHEELNEGIARVIKEQLEYIANQCEIPVNIDSSVHEIRKAFKRLRAVLRLIRFDIGDELFHVENVKFRELSRLLSKLRDQHVIISYLAMCFEANELAISEDNYIRFVNFLNKQKEEEMKGIMDGNVLAHIKEKAEEYNKAVQAYPLKGLGPHTINDGVVHAYKQCLLQMEQAQLKLEDESLHTLRKKVKYLLNQMLLVQEVWPEYFLNYSSSLKNVSEFLGNDHNLAEAILLIKNTPDSIINAQEKTNLENAIVNERTQIHEEVWPLMGKIFTEDSESFVKRVKSYWMISRE